MERCGTFRYYCIGGIKMTSAELKHRARLQEWSARIQDCRGSGLSVRAWCRQEGITAATYYRWEREVLAVAGTMPRSSVYNGPPVKTTHEKIIVNQIIPYQLILSPEPPCYRSAQRNCPAEQGCLDRLGLAGTMALARCPQLLNPLRTLAAAAQPARTRLSRSVACDAKQLW